MGMFNATKAKFSPTKDDKTGFQTGKKVRKFGSTWSFSRGVIFVCDGKVPYYEEVVGWRQRGRRKEKEEAHQYLKGPFTQITRIQLLLMVSSKKV